MLWTQSGFDILVIFMVPVLQETGSSIDPHLAPIIAGSVRAISAGFTPFFYKKISPKLLFVCAQFVASSSMFSLGFFSYNNVKNENLTWIPLAVIITHILMRALGTLPVMHTLMNELYPTEIRTQSIGLNETIFLGLLFLNTKLYPELKHAFGFHGACWFYATMGSLSAIWGFLTIPDNRGMSLVKVEQKFEKGQKLENC